MRWDDLRVVLAVARGGTLSAAAERLRVDMTTVSRRLAALEASLGRALFARVRSRLVPTEDGATAVAHAERVESEILALEASIGGGESAPEGRVRITAVPAVASRLLLPRLGALTGRYPKLRVEILAEPRNLSLADREAEIAVRLARPAAGAALCRRLGSIGFSVYARAGADPADLAWIGYDEAHDQLPQARWIAEQARRDGAPRILVNDAEPLYQAVTTGLGKSLIPDFMAAGDPRLARLGDGPVLAREAWLLVDRDVRRLPRVAAAIDWLDAIFAELAQ